MPTINWGGVTSILCGVVVFGVGISAAQTQNPAPAIVAPGVVEETQLTTDAFSTGTLDRASGALPPSLWSGAQEQVLDFLLTAAPRRPSAPSIGEAMRRTLLSPGRAPIGASPALGGKKLLALAEAGFIEEARTISSLSTSQPDDPWAEQAEASIDLYLGNTPSACRRGASVVDRRNEDFWVKLRVLCYVLNGENDAADLTLGVLRERGGLSTDDDILFSALLMGATPEKAPKIDDALQYAIARQLSIPVSPLDLANASGGINAAVASDQTASPSARILAIQHSISMGVARIDRLAAQLSAVEFSADGFDASALPPALVDAFNYQTIQTMSAPEFLRDKAKRIADALSLGDSFSRAYSLSVLYAHEIQALEGAIVAPDEAARFALARMAVADSVGAGRWLATMIGPSGSVEALPQDQAMEFIDLVNLLAELDAQTAAQIARIANISMLSQQSSTPHAVSNSDQEEVAKIVAAAFDAATGDKPGQAGLAAIAASKTDGAVGAVEAVIVQEALKAAGLSELQRRYQFEQAWASRFAKSEVTEAVQIEETSAEGVAVKSDEPRGFAPRLKPPTTN